MNRLIYFDNLRSLSIILTLAALLLPLGTVFYEGSTTIAIAVIFFISAYFEASKLRIRTITFFLKDRWHRLGLPLIVLVLFGIEEKIVTGTLPIVSWALAWLLLLFALLSLVKRGAHSFLQQRKLAPPSIPFLTLFFLLLAAALYGCRLFLPQSLIIPFIAVIRPDWLILSTFSFIMGLQAFRNRWFTANGYQPSLGIFIAFIVILVGNSLMLNGTLPANPWMTAFLSAALPMTAILGLTAFFHRYFNSHRPWSHTLHRLGYGLFFISEPIILHTAWFLHPLAADSWLKTLLTILILVVYSYLLCRYALLHLSCFKSKG